MLPSGECERQGAEDAGKTEKERDYHFNQASLVSSSIVERKHFPAEGNSRHYQMFQREPVDMAT